jgi:hypothetical protein
MPFDNSENRKKLQEAFDKLDKKILAEKVSVAYPDGVKEIAELLTFLPEEKREATVRSFVRAVINS